MLEKYFLIVYKIKEKIEGLKKSIADEFGIENLEYRSILIDCLVALAWGVLTCFLTVCYLAYESEIHAWLLWICEYSIDYFYFFVEEHGIFETLIYFILLRLFLRIFMWLKNWVSAKMKKEEAIWLKKKNDEEARIAADLEAKRIEYEKMVELWEAVDDILESDRRRHLKRQQMLRINKKKISNKKTISKKKELTTRNNNKALKSSKDQFNSKRWKKK